MKFLLKKAKGPARDLGSQGPVETVELVNTKLDVGRLVWFRFLNVETNIMLFVEDNCTVGDIQKKLQEHPKRYPGGSVTIVDRQGNPVELTMPLPRGSLPYFAYVKLTDREEFGEAKKQAVAYVKKNCPKSHSSVLIAPEAGFLPTLYVQIRKNDIQDKNGFYEPGSDADVAEARRCLPANYKGFPIKVVKLEYDEIILL
jgi:hypothetical protein